MTQTQQQKTPPILIIDRQGILGAKLALVLQEITPIVFISDTRELFEHREFIKQIHQKEYWDKIPQIPNLKYSHIFVVYTKGVGEFLTQFLKKAESDGSRIVLLFPLSTYRKETAEKIMNAYPTCSIIIFGDLFAEEKLNTNTIINRYLQSAQKHLRINVPNDGTHSTYPVFLPDAIEGILKCGFSQGQHLVFLFPQHPPTMLSLAHMIHKAEPEVTIDFYQDKTLPIQKQVGDEGRYVLGSDYPLAKRIRHVVEGLHISPQKKTILKHSTKNSSLQDSPKAGPKKLLLVLGILFVLALPMLATLSGVLLSFLLLSSAKQDIERGDFKKAQSAVSVAAPLLAASQKASAVVVAQASLIGQGKKARMLSQTLEIAADLVDSVHYSLEGVVSLKSVFAQTSKNPKSDFVNALNSFKNTLELMQRLQTRTPTSPLDGSLIRSASLFGQRIIPSLELLSGISEVLPQLVGFDGQRKYLLLFQNNMELRPGGGFIGSYGLVTLKNGLLKEFRIYDVYDADGQLKAHIEPSFPVRRYLGNVHLYLRDSNFDVDFQQNASNAARLLFEEKGDKVDGVVGVDVLFVKELLSAIGSVYVADYDETITSQNLFLKAETHAEKNFFEGSTQKKEFLRSVFNAMRLKLETGKNLPYLAIAKAVRNAILQKHILFAFANPTIQSLFTVQGMSGALWDQRPDDPQVINDFLGINEANVGINKANYFLSRRMNQSVGIDTDGSITERVTVSYSNASNGWPGGDYTDYFRLIVPQGAILADIAIDDAIVTTTPAITDFLRYEAKNFKKPDDLEIETQNENGKTLYGFLITVPAKGTKKVTVSYTLAKKIDLSQPVFSYDLMLFKQPGTDQDPYTFSLSYPDGFKILHSTPGIESRIGNVVYTSPLTTDKNLRVDFTKK